MSKRLSFLSSKVSCVNTLLDVGCDHGILSKLILDEKRAKKALLSDISALSLNKAKNLLSDYENVSFFHTDGIKNISEPFDFVVIAGMGGLETVKILTEGQVKTRGLLQPMNNVEKVRDYLVENGYQILSDEIFFDKKFYNVITFDIGKDELTLDERVFGRTNLKEFSDHFKMFLVEQQGKFENILKKLDKSQPAFDEYVAKIAKIESLLERKNENC